MEAKSNRRVAPPAMARGMASSELLPNSKQARMDVKNIALLTRQKSLIYTTAMSYTDFLAQSAAREVLQARQGEIRLAAADQRYFVAYPDVSRWLVIVSDESPDTVAVLPVLMRVAACSPRIDVRLLLDDDESLRQAAALVDDPAVAAGLADADYPLLLAFDEEWTYQDQWGPHPQEIEPYLDAWLADHPDFERLAEDESPAAQVTYEQLLDELTQAMRLWYNSGLNRKAITELRRLLVDLHDGDERDTNSDDGEEAEDAAGDDDDDGDDDSDDDED